MGSIRSGKEAFRSEAADHEPLFAVAEQAACPIGRASVRQLGEAPCREARRKDLEASTVVVSSSRPASDRGGGRVGEALDNGAELRSSRVAVSRPPVKSVTAMRTEPTRRPRSRSGRSARQAFISPSECVNTPPSKTAPIRSQSLPESVGTTQSRPARSWPRRPVRRTRQTKR